MKNIIKEAFIYEANIKEANFTDEIDKQIWNRVCDSVDSKNFFYMIIKQKTLKISILTSLIVVVVFSISLNILLKSKTPSVSSYPVIPLYVIWNNSIYTCKDEMFINKKSDKIGTEIGTEPEFNIEIFEVVGEPSSQKIAVMLEDNYLVYERSDALKSVYTEITSETKLPFSNRVGKIKTKVKNNDDVEIPIELETKVKRVNNTLYNIKFIASWKSSEKESKTLTHSWEYQIDNQTSKLLNEAGSPLPEFD